MGCNDQRLAQMGSAELVGEFLVDDMNLKCSLCAYIITIDDGRVNCLRFSRNWVFLCH